ncbi:MAG TPA: GNAT family N-acetyltransferase [Candidatus Limnocylindria bacterium]|nr:GNAT family N-acetyltransferase [Candidatus Limnocylindria bacterium]
MVATDASRVADLTTQLGYPSTPEQISTRFAAIDGRPESVVLVATDDSDAPIGWIQASRVAALAESDVAMIGGLVVGDGHRSGGIGAELLDAAEEWAREHGAVTMSVRSRTERARAHRFYEAHGYRQIKLSHVFAKPLS